MKKPFSFNDASIVFKLNKLLLHTGKILKFTFIPARLILKITRWSNRKRYNVNVNNITKLQTVMKNGLVALI